MICLLKKPKSSIRGNPAFVWKHPVRSLFSSWSYPIISSFKVFILPKELKMRIYCIKRSVIVLFLWGVFFLLVGASSKEDKGSEVKSLDKNPKSEAAHMESPLPRKAPSLMKTKEKLSMPPPSLKKTGRVQAHYTAGCRTRACDQ